MCHALFSAFYLFHPHHDPMTGIGERLESERLIWKLLRCARPPNGTMLLTGFTEVETEAQRS